MGKIQPVFPHFTFSKRESGNEKPMQKPSLQKRAEAHKIHLLQTFGHLSTPLQASIQPLSHSQYFKGLQ